MRLRAGLGKYEGGTKGLTLHDLGELIRRAGVQIGLTVKSEFPAGLGARNRHRGDWIWYNGVEPVIAFELEGRDVYPESVRADAQRFATLPDTCTKVLALYSVADDHRPKRFPPFGFSPLFWVVQHWPATPMNAHVALDTELIAPGGIETLQFLACHRVTGRFEARR